jgi:hypothetical protein
VPRCTRCIRACLEVATGGRLVAGSITPALRYPFAKVRRIPRAILAIRHGLVTQREFIYPFISEPTFGLAFVPSARFSRFMASLPNRPNRQLEVRGVLVKLPVLLMVMVVSLALWLLLVIAIQALAS